MIFHKLVMAPDPVDNVDLRSPGMFGLSRPGSPAGSVHRIFKDRLDNLPAEFPVSLFLMWWQKLVVSVLALVGSVLSKPAW